MNRIRRCLAGAVILSSVAVAAPAAQAPAEVAPRPAPSPLRRLHAALGPRGAWAGASTSGKVWAVAGALTVVALVLPALDDDEDEQEASPFR